MEKKRDVLISRDIKKTFSSILAIIVALILTGIFIWLIGFNPIEAYTLWAIYCYIRRHIY